MYLKKIKIKNFKTFLDTDIELSKFCVLIGANASGKSNFISALRFLRDIVETNLEDAISFQGGIEFISNLKSTGVTPLTIGITVDSSENPIEFGYKNAKSAVPNRRLEFSIKEWEYELTINISKKNDTFKVLSEIIIARGDFTEVRSSENKKEEKIKNSNKEIKILVESGKVDYIIPDEISWFKEESLSSQFSQQKKGNHVPNKESYFNTSFFFMRMIPLSFTIQNFITDITIYDIDPRQLKKSRVISGKKQLEPDGGNLAIILGNLQKNKRSKEKYLQLVKDFLPFVSTFEVLPLADNSVITSLNETYNPKKKIPASLISDGTLNITALLIPIVFEKKTFIVIEEPERNIHPSLNYKLIELMKDVTTRQKKQIIITTHNPEMVRNAGIENLLLVSRNPDGFSKIDKPKESIQIKSFLENNMGLGELYVNNLLEWK